VRLRARNGDHPDLARAGFAQHPGAGIERCAGCHHVINEDDHGVFDVRPTRRP
jgi:hypothetical protein